MEQESGGGTRESRARRKGGELTGRGLEKGGLLWDYPCVPSLPMYIFDPEFLLSIFRIIFFNIFPHSMFSHDGYLQT